MSAGTQDSTEPHKVTSRAGRFSLRTLHSLHISKETAHIMGQSTRHSRSECPPLYVKCYKCKRMGHYGKVYHTRLWNRPSRILKLYWLKLYMMLRIKSLKTACTPTYVTSMVETYQVSAVPVCKMHSHSMLGEHIRPLWLVVFQL